MKKVSRSDKQYKEIEKFKDYELTQCIAYEMAIRNPKIKELIAKRDASDVLNNFDEKWMDKLNKIKTAEEEDTLMLEFIDAVPGREDEWWAQHKLQEDIKYKCFFHIPKQSKSIINEMMENKYYIDSVSRDTQRAQIEKSSLVNFDSHKSCFLDDGTVKTASGGTIKYAKLFPGLSRQIPTIPIDINKEIDIPLNLALPAKELLAYVETIKTNYDKSHGEVFQAATPLSSASEIDKEIFSIRIKVKKKGSDFKLKIPEKSQQEVYADLFFMYDVDVCTAIAKKGDKLEHFRSQMIDYYAQKVARYHGLKDKDDVSYHIGSPREQTVRECIKMMHSYIDDYGYKKLLV